MKILKKNSFIRSVGVLVGGAAFAHVITAAALPIASRLYAPADFSVLAVFSSVLSLVATAGCLRFDVAIPLPQRDDDALNILALAVICVAGISTVFGLVVLFASSWLATQINQPGLEPYLWLLPIGVLLAGLYSALQSWFVRRGQFPLLARTRIVQSAMSVWAQLGMGLLAMAPVGLLIGYVMNTGTACVGLGYRLLHGSQKVAVTTISWSRMKFLFKAYDRYPKYSTLEALCNSAAIQLPVIMIAVYAPGSEVGYLALAMSVMQAPTALLGVAIGQVYLSRAPDENRVGRLASFTMSVFGGLLKAGLGPLLVLGMFSPVLFGVVFGERWERAGWFVTWMTPWFIFQFLASPISMALHISSRQKLAVSLQLYGLAIRVISVWLASQWVSSRIVEAYALSGLAFYLVYLATVLLVVRVPIRQVAQQFLLCVPVTSCWVASGVLFLCLANFVKNSLV